MYYKNRAKGVEGRVIFISGGIAVLYKVPPVVDKG